MIGGIELAQKTLTYKLRIAPDEKESFQAAADLAGVALSAWKRERLRSATINELERAGLKISFLKPIKL
jgi:hypothetical protein